MASAKNVSIKPTNLKLIVPDTKLLVLFLLYTVIVVEQNNLWITCYITSSY